ncbi:hypothetical protein [Nonomuraea sp. JJY05]|uniref:hypothetical protein n=1 Tax=Nonomuraea sp. JJY05 TaxID=3350255 RepID=UPI00373E3E56
MASAFFQTAMPARVAECTSPANAVSAWFAAISRANAAMSGMPVAYRWTCPAASATSSSS